MAHLMLTCVSKSVYTTLSTTDHIPRLCIQMDTFPLGEDGLTPKVEDI